MALETQTTSNVKKFPTSEDQLEVAALGGTLTGLVDGDLADVAAIALDTSNTYSDSAVNTAVNAAITSVNLQLKELQTKVNEIIADLKALNIFKAD